MSRPLQDSSTNSELFIKALNFSHLTSERLHELAAQVEEVSIAAGEEIIKQGEEWDCCYWIQSGQIELLVRYAMGAEYCLGTLAATTLLGDATIVVRSSSQATVRAVDECKMLKLRHEHLVELSENKKNIATTFMSLMMEKIKPVQNTQVTQQISLNVDGQEIVLLKNPAQDCYFKLSAQAYFVWQQFTGKYTLREITLLLADKFNIFAPDMVVALVSKLASAGMLENKQLNLSPARPESLSRWARIKSRILNVKIAMSDADQWISRSYRCGINLFFSRTAQWVFALLAIVGACLFVTKTNHSLLLFKTLPYSYLLLGLLLPFYFLAKIIHELSYAYATKAYGYQIHYVGIGWRWFRPLIFIDTSDMWLSTRRSRVFVSLVGIWVDIILAGITATLACVLVNPYLQAFLWLFALYNYLHALKTLNPLQELGGYSALTAGLGCSYLRQSAIAWLIDDCLKTIRQPQLFKPQWPEIIYWLTGIFFLLLVGIFILVSEISIFNVFGIHLTNLFVVFTLPFFVVLVLSLSIIADLRSHVMMRKI